MGVLRSVVWLLALFGVAESFVDKTVFQYLVDNAYSSFVQLLTETGQDKILSGEGPITVFAPSNTAISQVDPVVLASFASHPWQKASLVKYHLVHGYVLVPAVPVAGTETITTVAGQGVHLQHDGQTLLINNASHVTSTGNDIICTNGVVQPIDAVLLPPLYSPYNLFYVLVKEDQLFGEFVMGLLLANLTHVIENGEFTLFGPTNAAYAHYVDQVLHPPNISIETAAKISLEMEKYHIVPGARPLDTLKHNQKLYTLHGTPLDVKVLADGTIMVDQARIVQGNIPAANGVVHAINDVLFPHDLLAAAGIDPATVTRPGWPGI